MGLISFGACRSRPWRLALLEALLVLALRLEALEALATTAATRHPCDRPCEAGRPRVCRYDFHVESYHSMSKACYGCPWNATDCARPDCVAADGVPRALITVNRQMPGPSLQVCLGDRLEVTVHNHMPEQSTSIHWHGMLQRGTPYMDGVPFVTQCPVQSHSAFRYSFRADTPGTHFWHSHTGCQRADGAMGLLTVRVPRHQDPHTQEYDEDLPEHGVLVWDWTHQPAASKFLAHHHAGADNKADSVLINGKGAFRQFARGGASAFTPREEFAVKQGLRYRFRVVNAGFLNCPLELTIDNHTLLVIASDGADVKPVRVDSLVTYAGERWDVVVEANQPVANYWVRFHGLLDCGPRRAHEAAVLRYEGADAAQDPAGPAPSYDVTATGGLQLNPFNRGSADPDTLTAAELQALPPRTPTRTPAGTPDPALRPHADVQLFVSYDFYAVDNPHIHRPGLYGISQVPNSPARVFTPQLNHISLSLPAFPLLPGRDLLRPDSVCNETSLRAQGRDCDTEFCECTHVVTVPLGGVLEIVLVDQGVRYDANHPFHLHGHAFRVVALERLGNSTTVSEVQRRDAEGLIARNLVDPPAKDTVTVPDGGYTVLRVHADNPGYWLFHCHIEFHVELGMALVVKVGEHEDMPPVPRDFPQCGNWSSWLGGEGMDDGEDLDGAQHVGEDIVPSNHIGRDLSLSSPGSMSGARLRESSSSTTVTTVTTVTTTVSTASSSTSEKTSTASMDFVDPAFTSEMPSVTTIESDMEEVTNYEDQPDDSTETTATAVLLEHADRSQDKVADTMYRYDVEQSGTPSTTTASTQETRPPSPTVAVSEYIMRVGRRRTILGASAGGAAPLMQSAEDARSAHVFAYVHDDDGQGDAQHATAAAPGAKTWTGLTATCLLLALCL